MENRIPFFGATGFVPAPSSSGFEWSITTIIVGIVALLLGVYAAYHLFFKPSKSNDLVLEKKEVDPLRVMVDRELEG